MIAATTQISRRAVAVISVSRLAAGNVALLAIRIKLPEHTDVVGIEGDAYVGAIRQVLLGMRLHPQLLAGREGHDVFVDIAEKCMVDDAPRDIWPLARACRR
jgi:hypothetical protein